MLPLPTKDEVGQLPQSGQSKSQPTTPTRPQPSPFAPFKSSMGGGLNDAGGLTAAGEIGPGVGSVFGGAPMQLWRQRSWERSSPTARGPTSIFFQRKSGAGAARALSLNESDQIAKSLQKAKEPDHDEAFIEESGVKVVESRPQSEVEDSDDDEDDDDHSGDELYELEMVDDTINEEDEDDEDDDHHQGKPKTKSESEKNERQQDEDKSGKTAKPPQKSSGDSISGTKNELQVNDCKSSLSSASSANSNSGNSINSSTVATSALRAVGNTAGSGGLGKRDSSSSNSSKDSTTPAAETLTVEQTKKQEQQLQIQRQKQQQKQEIQTKHLLQKTQQNIQAAIKRGTGARVSLPATLRGPRHNFVIRKVSEPVREVSPAVRNNDFIDLRLVELKSPDHSVARPTGSPVWVKRQTQEAPAVISSAKASSGQSDSSDGGSGSKDAAGLQPERRPRSGTWSVANSRRVKIKAEKEEDASLRVRRKSGDDILAVSSNTGNGSNVASNRRKEGGPQGFFDSFRPRSKSDARAIMASRQRRKSGDDILNTSTKEKEKEKKKDDSPGFFQSFRPRSKSDASRMAKKPNIMTTMKHAVQNQTIVEDCTLNFPLQAQSLVSPGQSGRSSGGRRSGEATPVDQGTPSNDVYHTWHAGAGSSNLHKNRQQEQRGGLYQLMDLFKIGKHRGETTEDRLRRKSGGSRYEKGQLLRRHSVEPDKRRAHGSGGSMVYLRGEMDPCTAAMLFRDSRGLPAADPFLENIKRSDLEEDETQIFVKFFKYHHCYDLIPISAKLVVFDTRLQVKKAFYALVYNGVRAAPLWDSVRQCFVGMLTITDFIRILQNFYAEPNRKMEELEDHRLETWRTVLKDEDRPLISIKPDESLYEAIRRLIHHKIHRLPVIDHITGNVLYIITHKRILKFLYLYINELPKPFRLQQTLREVQIGTYDGIETAKEETTIIEALNKFVKHRVSALPIVDEEGKLIDIYAKFDVINLAAEGTYNNLDVTLKKANEYRNEWFEQVHRCTQEETLGTILERIVRAEVHRLVVVDQQDKVIGVISLSDILKELVLRPCDDQDPFSLKAATIARMEAALSAEKDSKSPTSPVMNPPSSQDIIDDTQEPQSITTQVNINGLHKTVSDDSVGDKWSSDEKLQRCGSSSSGVGQREDGTDSSQAINKAAVAGAGDSEEDEGRYSMGDMDDSHSSSVVQPEVIPITG